MRRVPERLDRFYEAVDSAQELTPNEWNEIQLQGPLGIDLDDVLIYYDSALQATNDRGSRKRRGDVLGPY